MFRRTQHPDWPAALLAPVPKVDLFYPRHPAPRTLDDRAMGKEIVRAHNREPPVLVAPMFSLAVPLLLASF